MKSTTTLQKVTILLSLLTLVASFTQPAFYIDRPEDPGAWANGLLLFLLGWIFPLGGALVPFLIWLANPIYIASIVLTFKGKDTGFYFSCLATFIAFVFSQLESIVASESGSYSKISSLELGYKLWLTSFVIMSLGTGLNQYFNKTKS